MKRKIKKALVVVSLIAGVMGIGANARDVKASDNTTGTYDEENDCWITVNGYWQYQKCENLDGSVEIAITEYRGNAPDPIMPAEIDGVPVTAILGQAFYQNETLTMVELPRTVRDIGAGAFTRCTSLTSVTIDKSPNSPDGVLEEGMEYRIGDSAFHTCTALETLQLPEGITNIGDNAFYGCEALESITIPETVTEIGSGAFYKCSTLYEVILPDSVESLGYCAFSYCDSLESVVLSPSLTAIEHHTFEYCPKLRSIVIPEGVTEIGTEAFDSCTMLSTAVIPSSVETLGLHVFFGCENLTIYAEKDSAAMLFADNVNNNVKGIPVMHASGPVSVNSAGFEYITYEDEAEIVGYTGRLADVEIPSRLEWYTVTGVAGRIFAGIDITGITIPNSVLSIGDDLCNGCTKLESVTLSSELTDIGDNAFAGCTALTEIQIPSKVTCIGSNAFDGCSKLTTVTFEERDSADTSEIEIGICAFKNCDLQGIAIPAGVNDIGEYTFYGNANMTSVTLPEGIAHIGSRAFSGCSKLKAVTLPSTLTYIWDYAFAGCESIKEIVIPDNVTDIEQRAFAGCTALEKATILSNVRRIGTGAFAGCDALTIHTNAGSAAETYAKDNEITYVIIGQTVKPPADDDNTNPGTDDGNTNPGTEDDDKKPTSNKVKAPTVSKVRSFKATGKRKALALSWKKSSRIDGYQIRIGTRKSLKGAKTITVKKTKTKYTVSKLKAKRRYYVQIRAYKIYKDAKGNKKKAYSKPVVINRKTK